MGKEQMSFRYLLERTDVRDKVIDHADHLDPLVAAAMRELFDEMDDRAGLNLNPEDSLRVAMAAITMRNLLKNLYEIANDERNDSTSTLQQLRESLRSGIEDLEDDGELLDEVEGL